MSQGTYLGVDEESPWPGLFPYSEEASAFFNGRERETGELLRLVRRDTLCLLYGQSGLGKSSLIQAGLFPRLRQEAFLPIYVRLDFSRREIDLRAQLWRVMSDAFDAHGVDARRPRPDEALWEYFNEASLEFWDVRNRALTPVLVFDQFEEVFTTGGAKGASPEENGFLRELGDLIDARVPHAVRSALEADPDAASRYHFGAARFRVLIGFREDFLPEFEDLFRALRLPAGSRLRLTGMREDQALEAVRRTGGRLVDAEVAAQIVAFVSGREAKLRVRTVEVEPALLSVVCYELNNRRRARAEPHISSALLSGAREQIIEEFYRRSIAGVAAEVREFIEDELLTESGYRDSAAIDDAVKRPGVTEPAIRELVEKRVLRLEERFGVIRVELTHDILAPVVRRDRDDRQERMRIAAEREREQFRQRRARRLLQFGATGLLAATALVVVFAVLLKRAEEEKARVIHAQSSLFLARGVAGLEQNIPLEPYRSLAQAIALDPENRAAAARAVSLLTQRRFPRLEWALPMNADSVRFLGEVVGGQLAISRDGTILLLRIASPAESVTVMELACVKEALASASDEPFVTIASLPLRPAPADSRGGAEAEYAVDASEWNGALSRAKASCGTQVVGKAATPPPHARRIGFDASTGVAGYASVAGEVEFRSPDGKRQVVSFGDDASRAVGMAMAPGKGLAAIALSNGAIEVFAIAPGNARRRMVAPPLGADESRRPPARLEFSPSGAQLLVVRHGHSNGTSADVGAGGELWRIEDARRIAAATLDDPNAAFFSPTGAWLGWVVQGGVEFVETATGSVRGRVIRPLPFNHVAFDDGNRIALLSSWDRMASFVRVPSGEAVGAPLLHEGAVVESSFERGGGILTASFDGTVRQWDATSRELLVEPFLHRGPVIWARPIGGHVATLADDQQLRFWRGASSKAAGGEMRLTGSAMEVSRDGRVLARLDAGRAVEVASVRTTIGGAAHGEFRSIPGGASASAPFALSRDGKAIAWTVNGTGLGWLMPAQASAGGTRAPMSARIREVAIAGNGLVAARLDDSTIRVIDTATARPTGLAINVDRNTVTWGLTDDGRRVLAVGESTLRAFDASTGYPVAFRSTAGIVSADVSRAAPAIVYSSGRAVSVWNSGAGANLRSVTQPAIVTAVRFSPDGSRFLAVSVDGRVQVREVATLMESGPALRHSNAVLRAEFSPDGRWVVTTSLDGGIRIWDPVSGQVVSDPLRSTSRTARPLIAGEGNWLAIVDGNGSMTEWRPLGLGFPDPLPPWFEGYYGALSGLGVMESPGALSASRRLADGPESWTVWWSEWKQYVDKRHASQGGVK